jgi:hypothetical protein
VYGIMSGVSALDPFFTDVRASAPASAVAALVRRNIGPTGNHYLGQDHLLLVNLTEAPLTNPALGVGTPGGKLDQQDIGKLSRWLAVACIGYSD